MRGNSQNLIIEYKKQFKTNLFTYSLIDLFTLTKKGNNLKKLITSLIFILSASVACAYETCLITADGKLTDISIENNDIIDVCPIFTIMNEKNTLLVRPLKEGETRFCVLKNNKDKILFTVKVEADKTTIDDVDGFDILGIDEPPEEYEFELDEPVLPER